MACFLGSWAGLVVMTGPAWPAEPTKEDQALQLLQRKVTQREKQTGSAHQPTLLPNGEKLSLAGIEELYLTILSRFPTPDEVRNVLMRKRLGPGS